MLAFSAFTAYRYAEAERARYYSSALDAARRMSSAVDRELGSRINALQLLSVSQAITSQNFAGFYATAREARRILGADLVLKLTDGQQVVDTAQETFGPPRPVRLLAVEEQALAERRPVISSLLADGSGARFLLVALPVLRDEQPVGVLSISITPSRLSQLLQQSELPDGWIAAVIDAQDIIVARSVDDRTRVGALASEDLRAHATGQSGVWLGTTVDGNPVLAAYSRVALAGWRVSVGVPVANVERPLNATMIGLLALAAAGLLLSAVVAFFFGGAIATSMRRLARIAADPANADRAARVESPVREVNAIYAALVESAQRLRTQSSARDAAETALAASKARLERILVSAPIGIIEFRGQTVSFANDTARELLSIDFDGERYTEKDWTIETLNGRRLSFSELPAGLALKGRTIQGFEVALHAPDHERIILSVNAAPILQDGEIVGSLATFVDITERQNAEEAVRQQGVNLEILNETGSAIAAQLDLETLVQTVTDAGVDLTGAAYGAFFYNVTNAEDEILTLYAISGASIEDFSKFPVPRNTKVFHPTFAGLLTVRSDDITQDARYGHNEPYSGMPQGHLPVRSYLAVPVLSRTGASIGSLLFGHPMAGRFNERHEKLLVGIAAQAAIGIDNARLYEAAQKAEAELRAFNSRLEQQIAERTEELVRANEQLRGEIEQRQIVEEQLRQAQKMEAVGQLTGGLAHDFNNLLAIIIGSLDVLRRRIERGRTDDLDRFVDAAMEGANRAASLTQRLLAFARRQPLAPEPINANKLVADMSELLRRTITETIQIETVLGAGLWVTNADRNQLENALLNLSVNARDAMPNGGQLTIETANFDLDARYVSEYPGVSPGQYVMIAVTDTGHGMSQEIISRAFDPFFTTKETGKGTGLGLSQIYGFIRQTGGHVKIYSEIGQGTTVRMYLPRFFGETAVREAGARPVRLGREGELVLVVEDEDSVRRASCQALQELGYQVIEASGARQALALLEAHPEVTLLFTDIVMPEVNGRELAERARAIKPDLQVLFTSGYTRNAIVHNGVLDPGVHLIVKPFTIDQLGAKLHEVLE